ncbi:MAG: Gfo/Idh/MocA family oxidoreductase, partial [Candidatus Omnitrophica bacterium]|nr:Gfo/Idh/MocA family oxidoreductase [Candidatus Omnitrophota bacterium]
MKFLVMGLGSIGKRHIMNLIAEGIAPADIGGVDPREDRRQETKARFGMSQVYARIEDSAKDNYDAAIICSPTSMHIDHALWLAKRKTHLLIEKPLSATLKGVDTLAKIVKDNRLQVMVAYIFRFAPSIRKLKEL